MGGVFLAFPILLFSLTPSGKMPDMTETLLIGTLSLSQSNQVIILASSSERLILFHANNYSADQSAHPRRPIRTFDVGSLESIIVLHAVGQISVF